MAEQPPPGKKWTECNYCGHWFHGNLSFCDKCNKPNDGSEPDLADTKPVTLWRAMLIGLGVLLISIQFLSSLYFKQGPSIFGIAGTVAIVLGLVTHRKTE